MPIATRESQLLERLTAAVASGHVTQLEVSRKTGVHQSQISRILAGQVVRSSRNFERLCEFAATLPERPGGPQRTQESELTNALLRVWDGTPAHAAALRRLLEAVGEAQNIFQKK